MKQRSLRSLSALQNHISINSSSRRALLDTLVAEVSGILLTDNEIPSLLREVLLSAQLDPVSIALLISMLALEGGRITSDHVSISVRNELQISNRHHVLHLTEVLEIVLDELSATGAVDLVVEGSLHLRSLLELLAGSGLLTLISVANALQNALGAITELSVDQHPRNILVFGGLVSSFQMKQRSLRSLSALQNHISINSSSRRALLDTLVAEVSGILLTDNEIPSLLREVLLSAQLDPVSIALLISMLALEGGRITSDHASISVRNELQIGNCRHIGSCHNILQRSLDDLRASRAVDLVVEGNMHLISLFVTLRAKAYSSRESESRNNSK